MNILFLCTSNVHRSKTAEIFFAGLGLPHEFRSAGLSAKYCKKNNSVLCNTEMLKWADWIFVMEDSHHARICEHTGDEFALKIKVLDIPDNFAYMQPELISLIKEKFEKHVIL